MIVHRSPGICFMADENAGKSQLGDCLMKAASPIIASTDVSRISEGEGRKEGNDGENWSDCPRS